MKKFTALVVLTVIVIIIILVMRPMTISHYRALPSHQPHIPRRILQTWKTSNHARPLFLMLSQYSIEKYAPSFEYMFFDDSAIETFMSTHYPHYLEKWQHFPYTIQRIDMFRYLALYHYGGVYLDADMILDHDLHLLLEDSSIELIIPLESPVPTDSRDFCAAMMDIGRRRHMTFEQCLDFPYSLGQYALASRQGHPFWLYLVDSLPLYPSHSHLFHKDSSDYEVYISTGPDKLTEVFYFYSRHVNPTILHSTHLLSHTEPQRFGIFGHHNFQGTWKNQQQ